MPLLASSPRRVALDLSPVEVASALRHLPGLVFFDTARDGASGDELSIIAAAPAHIFRGDSIADAAQLHSALTAQTAALRCDDGLPSGLVAGWVEYEGAFCFGQYDQALIFRHASQSWYELGDLRSSLHPSEPLRIIAPPSFRPESSRESFCQKVGKAQEYIAAGDIYQVNLAHRWLAEWTGDPFALYLALRHYSPAPCCAYLALGNRAVLSSSPESFLKMSGRAIRTRPIKGTRPRFADPLADEKSAFDLLTSAKELSELVMITDLERNDLGQICEFGSVRVAELLKLERYEQIFHLVSTVEGRLRLGISHLAALQACFPGGSITGAPKHRARQVIAELEGAPRGIYTGAVGWLAANEESQFNVAIRTVVLEDGHAEFQVGAGIVADSVPALEWEETLHKAAGILLAAQRVNL